MMKKIVVCGLVGGVILTLWGMVAWMLVPWHHSYMMSFKNEKQVASVIASNAAESGLYVMPNVAHTHKGSTERKEAELELKKGPFLFAAVCLEGHSSHMLPAVLKMFVLRIILVGLVAWLLLQSKLSYNKRVGFVTILGVVIALAATMPYAIWFKFPAGFVLACAIEMIVGWFLVGLAAAKITK